jgi:hypothetical protein
MLNIFTIFHLKPIYFAIWSMFSFHPVHVSVTNIEIDTAKQKIDYSVRIFADDFAYAIEHLYEKDIALDDGISDMEKEIVTDYTTKMFEIVINGTKCLPECQKIESMDNSLWIFFNVRLTENDISSLKVINRLLLDLFFDQTNLTIVNLNGKQTGYTFNYLNQEAEINVHESEINDNYEQLPNVLNQ